MTQENKHTPAPWFKVWNGYYWEIQEVDEVHAPTELSVSCFMGGNFKGEANADHIVKCVNLHDEMLAEMEKLAQALEDTGHEPPQSFYDVIKKARGE